MWQGLVGALLAFCNAPSAGWVVGEENYSLDLPLITGGYKKVPIITNHHVGLGQRHQICCFPGFQPFRVPSECCPASDRAPQRAGATALAGTKSSPTNPKEGQPLWLPSWLQAHLSSTVHPPTPHTCPSPSSTPGNH